jgi:hypothetical protein
MREIGPLAWSLLDRASLSAEDHEVDMSALPKTPLHLIWQIGPGRLQGALRRCIVCQQAGIVVVPTRAAARRLIYEGESTIKERLINVGDKLSLRVSQRPA